MKIPANLPDLDKDMDSCELFSTITSLFNDTNDEGVNSDLSRDEPMTCLTNSPHFKSEQIISYHCILCHPTSSVTSRQIASFKKKSRSNCSAEYAQEAVQSQAKLKVPDAYTLIL